VAEKTTRVLVIEDDREIADVVAMNTRDLGFETFHAFDGQEGLSKALKGEFDLVILDLMLPRLDGLSVCRELNGRNCHFDFGAISVHKTGFFPDSIEFCQMLDGISPTTPYFDMIYF
jgi:CheY-like chemotaxis protein